MPPVFALTGTFLLEYIDLVARWAEWAETKVRTWSGMSPEDDARLVDEVFRR